MKIIDLVFKALKNQTEEIPKNIKYDNKLFTFIINDRDYYNVDYGMNLFQDYLRNCLFDYLNDEVEIIEDNKKIEKLKLLQFSDLIDMDLDKRIDVIKENRNKINEIIDKLNKGE